MKNLFRFFSWKLAVLIFTGSAAGLIPLGNLQAQGDVSIQKVEFISGVVYQRGRKKSLHRTTSSVTLPDLNAILSPLPPKTKQVIPVARVIKTSSTKAEAEATTRSKTSKTTIDQEGNPRFGFGSGEKAPVVPVDPRIPIDPGYDPEQVPQPALPPREPDPVSQAPISPPVYQAPLSDPFPFAHGYYPRSYHYRTPYSHYSYGGGYGYCPLNYGGFGHGLYPSRAPLRGSFTSSRNYLSGFRSPLVKFRFSF